MEAALICSEDAAAGSGPMLPGCQAVLRVSQSQLEQVIRDQGQVKGVFRLKLLWVWAGLWWAKPPRPHTHMRIPLAGAPHQHAQCHMTDYMRHAGAPHQHAQCHMTT